MLGFNGGLIGKTRTTSLTSAVGVWTLDEQLRAERSDVWPILGDPDALAYTLAVEDVDGQSLEADVKIAIQAFVFGCKVDGIWSAIKASCILAGARTLAGALVPLVGDAPTNVNGNFVAGDYNRKTGLKGNGVGDGGVSTKYLNSNRNNNADPQNDKHVSVYIESRGTLGGGARFIAAGNSAGAGDTLIANETSGGFYTGLNNAGTDRPTLTTGFVGISRSVSTSYSFRGSSATSSFNKTSGTPTNENLGVFANVNAAVPLDGRIAFYSIGESLNLSLLDARVSTLITDIAAAIP